MLLRSIASLLVVVVAILYQQDLLGCLVFWWTTLFFPAVLAATLAVSVAICHGKKHIPKAHNNGPNVMHALLISLAEARGDYKQTKKTQVISINTDMAVQEIIDYMLRDYVQYWFTGLAQDNVRFVEMLESDIWKVVGSLSERLGKIDLVQFITQDCANTLYAHICDIRHARPHTPDIKPPKFLLHSWLENEETELDFLHKLANIMITHLFPKEYTHSCPAIKDVLRDILVFKVLKPTVDMHCDPDYINQTLLNYLEYREQLSTEQRRTFTYAASYEDFYEMIQKCADIELLKQFRYGIITEIMQATTINNWKKSQLGSERKVDTSGTNKGELLQNRNLTRYINQLTMSKSLCDKRIRMIGGEEYKNYVDDSEVNESIASNKVLSFDLIMNNDETKNVLLKFLKRENCQSLLEFWMAVEQMKWLSKRLQHQKGSQIYQMYVISPSSVVKLTRPAIKGMESFMIGDKGPEMFYEAQGQVYIILETKHYPSFIVSDVYHQYVSSIGEENFLTHMLDTGPGPGPGPERLRSRSVNSENDEDTAGFITQQSTYAKNKLHEIDDKIKNKKNALTALLTSQKVDSKIQKLNNEIEQEIESLNTKRRELEFHIERTEKWWENLGNWKAHIYNAEAMQEGAKMVPYFVIVVDLAGRMSTVNVDSPDNAMGWVITRNLQQFTALQAQLIPMVPWLKKKELPTYHKPIFKSSNDTFIEKAKVSLEEFLSVLLKDERISQSEPLYRFLSPSPQYLKEVVADKPKTRSMSLANLVKRRLPSSRSDAADYEFIFFDDVDSAKDEQMKNSIVKPLYDLIGEIFEIHGAFKWLHKSLMVFVQVTFGRSISRQLYETVCWVFSEPMIIYYLHLYRDSWWPNGELAKPYPQRTSQDQLHTRLKAKEKLLNSIPDALKNLVGENNSRQGAIKTFEIFQDGRLNKHLFYTLLEVFIYELMPELREERNKCQETVVADANDKENPNKERDASQCVYDKMTPSPSEKAFQFRFGPSK